MSEINGVSFDIWMTLVRSNPEYKPARNRLIADAFGAKTEAEYDTISTTLRSVDVASDAESDKTGLQYGAFERLQRTAQRLGIFVADHTVQSIAEEVQTLFLEYPLVHTELELLATLDNLRAKGREIALTSNTGFIDGAFMRKALSAAGILQFTDVQVFSNEAGVAKPDQRIFMKTASGLHLPNEQIVHVGDNPIADYEGATKAGMQAVYLTDKPTDISTSYPTIANANEDGAL